MVFFTNYFQIHLANLDFFALMNMLSSSDYSILYNIYINVLFTSNLFEQYYNVGFENLIQLNYSVYTKTDTILFKGYFPLYYIVLLILHGFTK